MKCLCFLIGTPVNPVWSSNNMWYKYNNLKSPNEGLKAWFWHKQHHIVIVFFFKLMDPASGCQSTEAKVVAPPLFLRGKRDKKKKCHWLKWWSNLSIIYKILTWVFLMSSPISWVNSCHCALPSTVKVKKIKEAPEEI